MYVDVDVVSPSLLMIASDCVIALMAWMMVEFGDTTILMNERASAMGYDGMREQRRRASRFTPK